MSAVEGHSGGPTKPAAVLPVNWYEDEDEGVSAAETPINGADVRREDPRETTRSRLAQWLMALLFITALTILLLAGLQLAGVIGVKGATLQELGQTVLTPVVTLTGTALGFYFGAQSAGDSSPGLAPQHNLGLLRKAIKRLW